jgi:hypothetical protein
MATYARPSLSGWEQGDDAATFSRPSRSTWEQLDGAPGGGVTGSLAITLNPVIVSIEGEAGAAEGSVAVTLNPVVVSITGTAGSGGSDIRLTVGAYWERGGEYASQSINRWQIFSVDGATMLHTGTGSSFDASGVEVIDINGAALDVGDEGRFIFWIEDSEAVNADKTVTLVGGYFTAAAQT